MKKWILSAAVMLVALSPTLAQSAQPKLVNSASVMPQRTALVLTQRMDAAIDEAIAQKRIVGTVVLVARNGTIVYHRAAGFADREAGVPMREDTLFRLASVTKPIVTAAVLRLVEQGRIGLDDPVTKWLPTFRPSFNDKQPIIRIRQLLTHTSGLSYAVYEEAYRNAGVADGGAGPHITLAENLRRLSSVPLLSEPGTQWHYGLSTDVLGAVLEKATGKRLQDAVANLVTTPLQTNTTTFTVTDRGRLAVPYADGVPEPKRMGAEALVPLGNQPPVLFEPGRALDPASYPSGGTGMSGTAGDLLRFFEVIRKGGAPLLSTRTVEQMFTDHVGPQAAAMGPGWGFGYGGAVLDDPQATGTPQSKGTLSWSGAYGNTWFIDPKERLTVVALTNTAFEGMVGTFARDVRNSAYE